MQSQFNEWINSQGKSTGVTKNVTAENAKKFYFDYRTIFSNANMPKIRWFQLLSCFIPGRMKRKRAQWSMWLTSASVLAFSSTATFILVTEHLETKTCAASWCDGALKVSVCLKWTCLYEKCRLFKPKVKVLQRCTNGKVVGGSIWLSVCC